MLERLYAAFGVRVFDHSGFTSIYLYLVTQTQNSKPKTRISKLKQFVYCASFKPQNRNYHFE
jgi:hypothetical protein